MKSIYLFLLLSVCTSKSFSQTKNSRLVKQAPNEESPSQNLLLKDPTDKLPIKAERTIEFTTNEASWIDVDVSPDGKTLLCSFLGNLYNLPSTGGTATQITRGLAINRHPVWSPDGKYFAYKMKLHTFALRFEKRGLVLTGLLTPNNVLLVN